MYEFPPPIWQNQEYTVGDILSILLFGIVIPLVLARLTKPKRNVVLPWAVVATVSAFFLGISLAGANPTHNPTRYMNSLPCSIILISCFMIARVWWISQSNRGFVESVLVIALFCFILSTAWLPAGVIHPRWVARRTQCKNSLKQIGLAFHNYHDQNNTFPPARLGSPASSWRIALLPYIEERDIAVQYDLTQPWDSAKNTPLQRKRVQAYSCPSRLIESDSHGNFYTSYVVPTGAGTIFDSLHGTPLSAIKDGSSNTLLAVEACGTEIIWTEPRDVDSIEKQVSVNGPGATKGQSNSMISSWHLGGAQVVLVDGSVKFLRKEIDPTILHRLLTKDAGDEITDDW